LSIRIVRLNALNTSAFGCGMPDQFVGDGDVSIRLAFAQHEFKIAVACVGFGFAKRVSFDAKAFVIEEGMKVDYLIYGFRLWRAREVSMKNNPMTIVFEKCDDCRIIRYAKGGVAETIRLCLFEVDFGFGDFEHGFEFEDLMLGWDGAIKILAGK